MMATWELVAIPLDEANAWVERHHRHHRPVVGHKFSIALAIGGEVVGVAIVGRPVARHYDDGVTLEVNRCCTDGTRNACSWLYSRAWRAAQALGYRRLITYTLPSEGGGSLRGAGWRCVGKAGGGSWSSKGRPRVDKHPLQVKLRWET
jgi:L-amino acid N-acyltransferase YncA